jgi:hypothetical protein
MFARMAGKHVNDIQAITRQSPITTEGLLEAVFSVGSTPRLYSKDPRLVELSSVAAYSLDSNDVSTEDKKSPSTGSCRQQLLETVTD